MKECRKLTLILPEGICVDSFLYMVNLALEKSEDNISTGVHEIVDRELSDYRLNPIYGDQLMLEFTKASDPEL